MKRQKSTIHDKSQLPYLPYQAEMMMYRLVLLSLSVCLYIRVTVAFTAFTSGAHLLYHRRDRHSYAFSWPLQDDVARRHWRRTRRRSRSGSRTAITTSTAKTSALFGSFWQSHISNSADALQALERVLGEADDSASSRKNNSNAPPSIVMLFVGRFHGNKFPMLCRQLSQHWPTARNTASLAVVGGGVVGDGIELDESGNPSLSILCGYDIQETSSSSSTPEKLELFSFNALTNPPPSSESLYWKQLLLQSSSSQKQKEATISSVFIMGDPWSPLNAVLEGIGQRAVVMGGISVPTGAGSTVAINGEPLPQGSLVGWRLPASLQLQVMTAQGCRPVDAGPATITACQDNVVLELNGKPALEALEQVMMGAATEDEKRQISSGLVVGIATTSSMTSENAPDDYLIRTIVGFVPSKGGIVISGGGKQLGVGDLFRFFVRDKHTAKQDFELMVQRAQAAQLFHNSAAQQNENKAKPVAALQVSCVARGRYLFGGTPNVDIDCYKKLLGGGDDDDDDDTAAAVGGFYANGELGPVGLGGFAGSSSHSPAFMHAFTTVVGIIREVAIADGDNGQLEGAKVSGTFDDVVDAWG
jgi:small ligand-binding sensory domain FIST